MLKQISYGALIAALYVTITYLLHPLSYLQFQVRVSEALTILPIITPIAIPALFIGAFIANIPSPLGPIDMILGSTLTLIAAAGTYFLRRRTFLALLSPVVVNAFGVSLYLAPIVRIPYLVSVASVGVGEATAVFVFGYPLLLVLRRLIKEGIINFE